MKLYFGWVGVGGHFLYVHRGGWVLVEVCFGWLGVDGHFLWVSLVGCIF